MLRLILFIVVVAVLAAGAVWLADDPGQVMLLWHGWRADTSVAILLVAVIIFVAMLLAVVKVTGLLRRAVEAFMAARRDRRLKRGLLALGDGFAAVHAGHPEAARRLAREAGTLLEDSPAVLVLKKQAAELGGDTDELKSTAEALLERPETEVAALKALAGKARSEGDRVGALGYARRALARRDAPAWALTMALDLEIAAGHWEEALGVLDSKAGRDHYGVAEHRQLETRLLIRHAQTLLRQGDAAKAAAVARHAMDSGRGNSAAVAMFAKAMAAQGRGRKAAGEVERSWAEAPGPELLAAYRALVPGEPALAWARRVEHLVEDTSDHPESRLALAEASLDAELWGQARNRLSELTTELHPPSIRARAARLMAEVESRERGDATKVSQWLRQAIAAESEPTSHDKVPTTVAELMADA